MKKKMGEYTKVKKKMGGGSTHFLAPSLRKEVGKCIENMVLASSTHFYCDSASSCTFKNWVNIININKKEAVGSRMGHHVACPRGVSRFGCVGWAVGNIIGSVMGWLPPFRSGG